jgi:hypothetical protein
MDTPMGGGQKASNLDDFERWATVGELRKHKIEPEDGMWPPEGDRKPLKILLISGGYWSPLVREVVKWENDLPIVRQSDGIGGFSDSFGPVMSKDWKPFDPRPQWVRIKDRAGLNPPYVRRVISWNPNTVVLPRFSREGKVVGDTIVCRKDVEPFLPKWAKIIDMALPLPPTLMHGKVYEIVRWTEIGEPVIKTGEKKECILSRLCHVRDENNHVAWTPVDELVDASDKVLIPSIDSRTKTPVVADIDPRLSPAPKKRMVRVIGPSNAENLIIGKLYEVVEDNVNTSGSVMVKHEGGKNWYLFPKADTLTWGKDPRHPIYVEEDDQEIYVKITGPVDAVRVQPGKIYKVVDWYVENLADDGYCTISGPRILNEMGNQWKLYPPKELGSVRPGWELSTKEEFEKQEASKAPTPEVEDKSKPTHLIIKNTQGSKFLTLDKVYPIIGYSGEDNPKIILDNGQEYWCAPLKDPRGSAWLPGWEAFDPDKYVFQKGDVIEVPSLNSTKPYVAILINFVHGKSIDKAWMLQYPSETPPNKFDSWGNHWPPGVKLLRKATKEELIACGLKKGPEVKIVAISPTTYQVSPFVTLEKPKVQVPKVGDCVSISRPAGPAEARCLLDSDWSGNGKAEIGMIVYPSRAMNLYPGEVVIKPIFSSDPGLEMQVSLSRLKKAEEYPFFDVVDDYSVVRCSKNPYKMFDRIYGIIEYEKGATSHLNGMVSEMIHWVEKDKGIWIPTKMIGFPNGFQPKRWIAVTQAFAISDANRFRCLRDQWGSMQFHIPTNEWILMTSADQEKFWGRNSRNTPIEGYIRDLDVCAKIVRWPTPQEEEKYGLTKF